MEVEDKILPGSEHLLEDILKGRFTFVGLCEALDEANARLGYSGVIHAQQKFKILSVVAGNVSVGNSLDLWYSYLASDMGFANPGRTVEKGERVIWIVGDRVDTRGYCPGDALLHGRIL